MPKYHLEVKGFGAHASMNQTVANVLADMLRYDSGELLSEELGPRGTFTATVLCDRYTKARWDYFMLRTTVQWMT
jgi:hypothetical protein